MKYASEVICLLEPYPDREFRIGEIVRFINPVAQGKARDKIRLGVSRALFALVDTGAVRMTPPKCERSFALYRWNKKKEKCGIM